MADREDRLIASYAGWVIRWRLLVVILCVAVAGAAGYGLRYLQFTSDFRIYFGPGNPELVAFENLENTYTKTDNILFVLQPAAGDIFTRGTLELVSNLTEDAWQIPYAIRVDSITNFQHTEAVGDDLSVADLVENPAALSDAGLARVREIALGEVALVDRLVAPDARTTGVFVTLQFPGDDHTEHLPKSVLQARELAKSLRGANPGLTVAVTGMAAMSYAESEVSQRDLATLAPLMYLFIAVLLILLLRSLWGSVAALVVVSLSTLAAMGMSAWLGIMMHATSAAVPVVILTLAIADSVHILMTVLDEMRQGKSRNEALFEALRVNAEPVFLTSLTTAIAFLSLNFSDAPPFHDLGNIAAMGVFAAWVFSMTCLPALIAMFPITVRRRDRSRRLAMERFGDFVVGRRNILLSAMTVVTLLVIAFIPFIEFDDRFVEWFDDSLEFRTETDFATDNLIGPYSLEFSLDSGESGGIAGPAYLEHLENFATWLRTQPEVTHVGSLADVMKRVNKSMHGDDVGWYRLPDARDQAAQYLLLYEMSLPYGLDLNSQINVDKSASRLTVVLETIPTRRMREVAGRAEAWLRQHTPPSMWARASGPSIMFAYLTQRNIRTMLTGTAVAFVLIAGILMITLRSIRLGAISMLSNFVPVLLTFGVWSALVGEMGIIASVITATSMGIIVDDTVHILSKYNRAHREHCLGTHDGIRFTFRHVGNALWVTTAILVVGFAVLGFSPFQTSAHLGILTAMTVAFALAVDFLMLPPLLMLVDKEPECHCVTCECEICPAEQGP